MSKLPTPCPIHEHVRALNVNANSLLTKIRIGNRKVTRLSNVAAYARANNLDLLGIQEPHVLSAAHYNSITDEFRKHGYSFQSQTHPSGYGGVGIAWKSADWTLRNSLWVHHGFAKFQLQRAPLNLTICVAHFHHHDYQRERQWRLWGSHLHDPNLVLLVDHNSILDRGCGASVPPPFEHPELLAVRERELNVIHQASLVKVHAAAPFGDFTAISKDSFPRGYTYGYASDGKPGHHRLRRIDKIHASESLIIAIDSVFTTFVGKSNHTAVVLSMGPKALPVKATQPRFYCPTHFSCKMWKWYNQ